MDLERVFFVSYAWSQTTPIDVGKVQKVKQAKGERCKHKVRKKWARGKNTNKETAQIFNLERPAMMEERRRAGEYVQLTKRAGWLPNTTSTEKGRTRLLRVTGLN